MSDNVFTESAKFLEIAQFVWDFIGAKRNSTDTRLKAPIFARALRDSLNTASVFTIAYGLRAAYCSLMAHQNEGLHLPNDLKEYEGADLPDVDIDRVFGIMRGICEEIKDVFVGSESALADNLSMLQGLYLWSAVQCAIVQTNTRFPDLAIQCLPIEKPERFNVFEF